MENKNSDSSVMIIGVIPSYKPDEKLSQIVRGALAACSDLCLIVVDDGSGAEFSKVFDEVASSDERVEVLHLAVNSGTGGAIKAGIQYGLYRHPDATGVVTFDADGQHHPEDVKHVIAVFKQDSSKFIIGIREFHDPSLNIPLRSRFGNRLTEIVFRLVTGIHLTDTQSGLRCYPRRLAEKCTQILRSRYEYQLEALMSSIKMADCVQVPIRTIYEENNRRSHFNPIVDSLKIYAVFLRIIEPSLICSVMDYILFALVYLITGKILLGFIVSKVVCNMVKVVPQMRGAVLVHRSVLREVLSFTAVAVALFFGAYYGVRFMKELMGVSPLISKIIVESILFACCFTLRRMCVRGRGKILI